MVENDKTNRTTCWHFFQKRCSNSKNVFSLPSKHFQAKNICDYIWSGNDRNFTSNPTNVHILQNILLATLMDLRYNKITFVTQILLQLCNWIHLHHLIWHVTNNSLPSKICNEFSMIYSSCNKHCLSVTSINAFCNKIMLIWNPLTLNM